MIEYIEEVKKIISDQFEIDLENIDDDSYFEADLNISELDIEDLIEKIEDKYHITIPPDSYSQFLKVSDLADYLYENIDQA